LRFVLNERKEMKDLDFNPSKSKEEFRHNYKLHDLAERAGKNLLVQWGIEFGDFGEDKRFEKLWEKGEDKPDIIINYKGTTALLDWKGKHSQTFLANTRAVKAYLRWQEKMNMPVIISFFVFDEQNNLTDRRFAILTKHNFTYSANKQWDKNKTVEFGEDLPRFTKDNLISFLLPHKIKTD
jgi:hypothetical protein